VRRKLPALLPANESQTSQQHRQGVHGGALSGPSAPNHPKAPHQASSGAPRHNDGEWAPGDAGPAAAEGGWRQAVLGPASGSYPTRVSRQTQSAVRQLVTMFCSSNAGMAPAVLCTCICQCNAVECSEASWLGQAAGVGEAPCSSGSEALTSSALPLCVALPLCLTLHWRLLCLCLRLCQRLAHPLVARPPISVAAVGPAVPAVQAAVSGQDQHVMS